MRAGRAGKSYAVETEQGLESTEGYSHHLVRTKHAPPPDAGWNSGFTGGIQTGGNPNVCLESQDT